MNHSLFPHRGEEDTDSLVAPSPFADVVESRHALFAALCRLTPMSTTFSEAKRAARDVSAPIAEANKP